MMNLTLNSFGGNLSPNTVNVFSTSAALASLSSLGIDNLTHSVGAGVGAAVDDGIDSDEIEADKIYAIVSKVVPVFFGLIGITGLLGNALVVIVVLSNPQMRSTTNLLIINLAIADLLFVIFCIPFTATDYIFPSWPFGDIWCKIVQYLIVVTAHASIYTLVLMSLDRFLAVVHPIASMVIRTERHTVVAILLLWILILFTALPVSFAHGIHVSNFLFLWTNIDNFPFLINLCLRSNVYGLLTLMNMIMLLLTAY